LVATTANITLSGTQTIDGVAVIAGDRVLVKNQSTPANNGIYVASASTWSRATDANTSTLVAAEVVSILSGTANGGSVWTTDFKSTDTLGTTAMYWSAMVTDYQVSFIPTFMLGGM
jgi:phage-related tail fiber protein